MRGLRIGTRVGPVSVSWRVGSRGVRVGRRVGPVWGSLFVPLRPRKARSRRL